MKRIIVVHMQENYIKKDHSLVGKISEVLSKTKIPSLLIEHQSAKKETLDQIKQSCYKFVQYKSDDSAFISRGLVEQHLVDYDIKELLVMGIYAALCVRYTIEDALYRDYKVLTNSELIGTKSVNYDWAIKNFYKPNNLLVDMKEINEWIKEG